MSRRNAFDLTCAQDVFRLNRDGDDPQEPPKPSRQPHAVVRRSADGHKVRVTPVPANLHTTTRSGGLR
jgi:hypothetical protein